MPTQIPDFINFETTSRACSTNVEQLLKANDRRRYLLIQNTGSAAVNVAFGETRGPAVSATAGLKIGAGEAYEMHRGARNVNAESVYTKSASGSNVLVITEGAYEGEFTEFSPPPVGDSSSSSSSSSSTPSSASSESSSSSSHSASSSSSSSST